MNEKAIKYWQEFDVLSELDYYKDTIMTAIDDMSTTMNQDYLIQRMSEIKSPDVEVEHYLRNFIDDISYTDLETKSEAESLQLQIEGLLQSAQECYEYRMKYLLKLDL